MLSHRLRSLVVVCLLVFGATAIAQAQTLERVKSRGRLVCGVNNALPGFGYIESDGSWSGFDVDFCRAIAAAVLGDPEAVEFVPLSAAQRQPAIQTGEVDVLIRNTTWTLSRDTEWTADFAPTTFYDGQGFMVRKDLGVAELEDLAAPRSASPGAPPPSSTWPTPCGPGASPSPPWCLKRSIRSTTV